MRPLLKTPPIYKFEARQAQSDYKRQGFKFIKSALCSSIGSYCSFCELPIRSDSYIHNKKEGLPTTRPSLGGWDDYLLACGYCNEHRSKSFIDKDQCLWPDEDITFNLTKASPFTYQLADVRVKNEIGSSTTGIESSRIAHVVLIKANSYAPKDVRERAQETIDLYRLNTAFYDRRSNTLQFTEENTAAEIDMRLAYRTQRWDEASKTAINVKKLKELVESPVALDAISENVSIQSRHSGFWSVWVTVFWEAFKDQDLIKDIFFYTKDKPKEKSLKAYGSHKRFKGSLVSPKERSPGAPRETAYTVFPGTAVDRIAFPNDSGGK